MCRIAGVINNSVDTDTISKYVADMCCVLRHGGPDDEGFYISEKDHLVLGHRRLSIIDLSANGHQPMLYQDGRYVITYNGELYNYLELKEELKQSGSNFTTDTDTEVILAAYATWGIAAFEKFYGMFAFALLDNFSKEILLVRDAAGIKPLYYAHTKQGLAFASEVRAFKCIDYLQKQNPLWPAYFMAYGHLPEPITTLQDVLPLEKGNYLRYNLLNGSIKIKEFKQFNFIEKIDNRQEAIGLVKSTLEKSVTRHLISNAPIGVFLSGGLDSAIIAKLANKHIPNLNTLSLYFEDNKYSEKKFQDLLRNDISCSKEQHLLKEDDFHTALPQIINAMDLPCCDGINTWFISKYAKQAGLKAVLSGIGGDELYGGYPSFERIKPALLLQHLPDAVLKAGRFSGSKQFRRLAYLSIKGAAGRYLFLRGQFIPGDIARTLNADEREIWKILEESPAFKNIDYLTAQNQVSWMEINMYMQNQLLRDADVMGMSHGVEIRVPFLDNDFIELSLKISSAVKYSGKLGKQLLIDAFSDILPEQIWNRPKMGFTFPFKEWFSNNEYAREASNGNNLQEQHKKLVAGNIHWSQFFTLLLMQQYPNA